MPIGHRSEVSQPCLAADERSRLIEEMGLIWEELGSPRMEGRIVGYLMFSNAPQVSSAELASELRASAGSVSMATRRLVEIGFIRRVAIPGDRSRYFCAEEDVWGAFLAGERRHLLRRATYAQAAFEALGPGDEAPRTRLANMHSYMVWLMGYHRKMLQDWEQFKREQDATRADHTPTSEDGLHAEVDELLARTP